MICWLREPSHDILDARFGISLCQVDGSCVWLLKKLGAAEERLTDAVDLLHVEAPLCNVAVSCAVALQHHDLHIAGLALSFKILGFAQRFEVEKLFGDQKIKRVAVWRKLGQNIKQHYQVGFQIFCLFRHFGHESLDQPHLAGMPVHAGMP